jgi:CBS domain-containing protein
MQAREIMTTKIIAVRPETPASAIAHLLFEQGISAVPVIDESGAPIGMVSEGDLMPRDESEREARRDWWLKIIAEGETLSADYLEHVEDKTRTAQQIMSTPVITVGETADIVEVAELLSAHRIKRLPVVRDGRLVGIVSRADLVRAVAFPAKAAEPEPSLDRATDLVFPAKQLAALKTPERSAAPPAPDPDGLSADTFRGFVEQFEHDKVVHIEEAHRHAIEKRHQEARELMAATLSEETWQHFLSEARAAAKRGEEECLLFRFPCEVCSDHGRAVNVPDPSWPATLRGLPAQIFMRWKQELRPRGFGLQARVVDFPGGIPGHIGLFLVWGR